MQSVASLDVLPARALLDYAFFLEQAADAENSSLMVASAVECAVQDEESQMETEQALESAAHSTQALAVYMAAAVLSCESEDWEEALEACDRALRLAPEDWEARALRGGALVASGRAEEALPF